MGTRVSAAGHTYTAVQVRSLLRTHCGGRDLTHRSDVRPPALPRGGEMIYGDRTGKNEGDAMVGDEGINSKGTAPETLRAVIADDDPFARRVIKDVLQDAGVLVIAEARNGRQAVELTLYYKPDVVVMDVVMPELDGIVATRQIRKAIPEQLVIVLTGAGDDDDELGLQALRVGASGFLSKDLEIGALPRTLEGVRAGEAAVSRKMVRTLIDRLRATPTGSTGMRPVNSPLTAREWEVIDMLKAAKSTERIADELVLSTETVRSHVKNIHRKLGVRTREEAVLAADRMRGASAGEEPPDVAG